MGGSALSDPPVAVAFDVEKPEPDKAVTVTALVPDAGEMTAPNPT
jgi:hypothetical protein